MADDTSPPAPMPPAPTRADVFDQYMPIVLFLVLNSAFGLVPAIAAMTLWAVKAQVSRYRRGLRLGRVMPIFVLYLLIRGTLGIIYDSEDLYFGIGIGAKALMGVGLAVSVAAGRSVARYVLPYLLSLDAETLAHRAYRSASARITALAAVAVLVSAGFDVWLLQNSSTNEYVLIRMGTNWGLTLVMLVIAAQVLNRSLRPVPGFAGLAPLMEQRMHDMGMKPPSSSE